MINAYGKGDEKLRRVHEQMVIVYGERSYRSESVECARKPSRPLVSKNKRCFPRHPYADTCPNQTNAEKCFDGGEAFSGERNDVRGEEAAFPGSEGPEQIGYREEKEDNSRDEDQKAGTSELGARGEMEKK